MQRKCHGIVSMSTGTPLNEEKTAALINGTLSGTGAVITGVGCAAIGITCGITFILA